jgi:hypothetical protein
MKLIDNANDLSNRRGSNFEPSSGVALLTQNLSRHEPLNSEEVKIPRDLLGGHYTLFCKTKAESNKKYYITLNYTFFLLPSEFHRAILIFKAFPWVKKG